MRFPTKIFGLLIVASLAVITIHPAPAAEKLQLTERWIYLPSNLLVDENIDKLSDVMRRGAAVGYTHVNIADSKFCRLHEMPEKYFQNVKRLQDLATQLKLTIVPGVFPIGWSNDLLSADPNLAAGLPVQGALFVVKDGEARLVADPPVALPGGDMSDLKKWGWHDPSFAATDGAARAADFGDTNARLVQKVKVAPWRQYHISARFKTKNFRGKPEIKVLGGDQSLNYNDLNVKPTQDWAEHHTVFNSLQNSEVNVYFGCWGGGAGELWIDDAKIEEVGLLNALRRDRAPIVVKMEVPGDKYPRLFEGRDLEPIVDPLAGNSPWPGEFDVWHQPPTIKIKDRQRVPDGARLRVVYFHPLTIYGGAVMIDITDPKTTTLLQKQAAGVHKLWNAPSYFMNHDEIRLFGWEQSLLPDAQTAGKLLSDNVAQCSKILHDLSSSAGQYIWSDMFDPHHNAHDNYYLVHGTLAESWKGLDPSVTIMNWNFGEREKSLKWFAGRGHQQVIAGYYDAPLDDMRQWLDAAVKLEDANKSGKPSVIGAMYTTWEGNYTQLEAFAKLLDEYGGAKAATK